MLNRLWLDFAFRFFSLPLAFICLLGLNRAAANEGVFYRFQKGENLSLVLQAVGICPLYGRNGSVGRVTRENAAVALEGGNYIQASNRIFLADVRKNAEGKWRVSSENDLIFLEPIRKLAEKNCRSNAASRPGRQFAVRTTPKTFPVSVRRAPSSAAAVTPHLGNNAEKSLLLPDSAKSYFGITALAAYSGLYATDTLNGAKATIASGLNYGLGLSWTREWSSSFESTLSTGILREAYEKPSNRELSERDPTLIRFGFGATFKGPVLSLGIEAAANQRVLITAISATALTLKKVLIPEIALAPEVKLFRGSSGYLALQGRVSLAPKVPHDGATVQAGINSYRAKLFMVQNQKTGRFSGGIYGQYYELNSSNVRQNNFDRGVELQWALDIFGSIH